MFRVDLDLQRRASTPADLRRARVESRAQAKAAKEFEAIDPGKLQTCPICSKQIHEDRIVSHVNQCLDSSVDNEAPQPQAEPRATRNRQVSYIILCPVRSAKADLMHIPKLLRSFETLQAKRIF